MKFGQLILRRIVKIVATKSQILRLNAPKSISAGAEPHTPLGELTALAGFKGPTSKGRGYRKGGKGRRGGNGPP